MIASKHIQFLIVCVASLIAMYVGSNVVTLPIGGLMIVLATLFILVWTLFAGTNWWIPIYSGAAIGGTFYVGFKVYPIEIALALSLIGLLPLILAQDRKVFQHQRKRLPFIFYATAFYVLIRLLIVVVPAAGSRGSLARIVLSYTWPFLFAYLFHIYGSLSALRTAILLMFSLVTIRVLAALVGFIINVPIYIPGINYVLSVSSKDSLTPMRAVAGVLLFCALLFYHCSKSTLSKVLLLPLFAFSEVMVIMGAGRFMALVSMLTPVLFFFWTRKWTPLIAAVVLGGGAIIFINLIPESLDALPPSAGRALSGLVFTREVSESQFATTGSDAWHSALHAEGLRRWTQSAQSFLFGDGVHATPDFYGDLTFDLDPVLAVENAANIGAYESGLWTVLGLFGVVGLGLYALLLIYFLREIVPPLLRQPRGTFFEGFVYLGALGALSWFAECYFQGSAPSLEIVFLVVAWDILNEGKLDEEEPAVAPATSYRAPAGLSPALPARA